MTVKELIKRLQELDPDKRVIISDEIDHEVIGAAPIGDNDIQIY